MPQTAADRPLSLADPDQEHCLLRPKAILQGQNYSNLFNLTFFGENFAPLVVVVAVYQ